MNSGVLFNHSISFYYSRYFDTFKECSLGKTCHSIVVCAMSVWLRGESELGNRSECLSELGQPGQLFRRKSLSFLILQSEANLIRHDPYF
jgi:hypothetical protein